ncbi:transmembrane channel-like protein 5 [Alosa alosa]|nr:transmembrane channel-like protein 5 [Alosa alosa]
MSHYYSNEGIGNPAYYESDTLEVDRGFSRGFPHSNPYDAGQGSWHVMGAGVGMGSGGGRGPAEMLPAYSAATVPTPSVGVSRGGWRESWRDSASVLISPVHPSNPPTETPRWQPQQSYTVSMRLLGSRRMSLFPGGAAALDRLGLTEEDIQDEMENEEQDLVKNLVAMSTKDSDTAIRGLPMSFSEKKYIRSQVLAHRSTKQKHQFTCCADCSGQISMFVRRLRAGSGSVRQALALWQGFMKEVSGKFGSGVLSYFLFLKWLLMFNVFSFLVNFGFITIPQLVSGDAFTNTAKFNGLELLTGMGFFNNTIMFYGGYSADVVGQPPNAIYNMQLAYLLTIAVYMVLCGGSLIYSMATSFKSNFVLEGASGGAWTLLCSWDFRVVNERAVRQRKANLAVQLKESLSEKAQQDQLSSSEKLKRVGVHLAIWLLATGLAIGACAAIYFLSAYEQKQIVKGSDAATLLVPFVVSLVNLVVPLIYSLFNKIEHFSNPRMQVYAVIIRNVFLKMSILGILCYYWMNNVAHKPDTCWESSVGQSLYRLVVVDFFFLLLGSFFGEFLSNVIGTTCVPSLGVPEFDIARNVLDLIYSQTLAWISLYFSPLLTVIQIFKFFILFYVKKVSLMHNCQPPRKSGRAAQMQTIFIALLFLPSYVGALSVVAYTVWSLKPSASCGPFRGLRNPFAVVEKWMAVEQDWVVWIYEQVIRSELFFFLISLIVLVLTYFFWQLKEGRRLLIIQLRQRIANEGKDKAFLLEKLQKLQKSNRSSAGKPKTRMNNQRNVSNRQWYAEPGHEEALPDSRPPISESGFGGMRAAIPGSRPPMSESGFGVSESGFGGMRAAVPDMGLNGLRAAVPQSGPPAQLRADPASSTPSGLIQAMLARQQAEQDDDDYDY